MTGGAGGKGFDFGNGGSGAAVNLTNAVGGSTIGSLYLSQSATGGAGGSAAVWQEVAETAAMPLRY